MTTTSPSSPAAGGKGGQRYHVRHNSSQLPLSAHVFATKCGKKFKTYVVEKGRVSEIAEWKDESQDASGVELTIRAFRNSNGDYVDEFGDVDGIAATSGS